MSPRPLTAVVAALGVAALAMVPVGHGTMTARSGTTQEQTGESRRSDRPTPASGAIRLPVTAVETIGMTVADMDRSVAFYTAVLMFEKMSDVEVEGRPFELSQGVFGARARVVTLRLGDETIELTQYLAPQGRPFPDDVRPNDRVFQHAAIIVSDMDQAYAHLRRHAVQHASTAPQRLPAWNKSAAGIRAFYFRDPDRHFLEVLSFPPDKGPAKWHRTDRLFLGIDHTAIVVDDTDETLGFYRELLQMKVAGESDNYDIEQEHLNNVFGARLRITTLRAPSGPGIELLEYLAPSDGRPAPVDLKANDIAHWQTTLATARPDEVVTAVRSRLFRLVSPGAVALGQGPYARRRAALVRDPDGHAMRLMSEPGD